MQAPTVRENTNKQTNCSCRCWGLCLNRHSLRRRTARSTSTRSPRSPACQRSANAWEISTQRSLARMPSGSSRIPTRSAGVSHSEYHFPAPSSKLCQNWLCHWRHTPSITFQHLPPDSARIVYATEGALFISAQLSTDAVSTLWNVWVLIRLWKQHSIEAHM